MGAQQRIFRRRIKTVQSTKKITKAMELIASSRIVKAQQRVEAALPYTRELGRAISAAASHTGGGHPLTETKQRLRERAAVLIITADRGLAGGFNSQIIRAGVRLSAELSDEGKQSAWYATGRRGVSSISFRGHELSGTYTGFADRPAYADARTIADDLIQAYADGRLDRVEMVYNSYISPLTQKVTYQRLLPLSREEIEGDEDAPAADGPRPLVDYEPDPEAILRRLVPDYIEISVYRALVESAAGFFGAQMTAMRSASENAGEIITDYTLQMNRARQAEITQEIMEVVAGAEGLS